jgi:hypothetical protein
MNAGLAHRSIAGGRAYTPPRESRCFSPVIVTTDRPGTRRCTRLAICETGAGLPAETWIRARRGMRRGIAWLAVCWERQRPRAAAAPRPLVLSMERGSAVVSVVGGRTMWQIWPRTTAGDVTGGCAARDAARLRHPVKAGLGSRHPQAARTTATRRLSSGPRGFGMAGRRAFAGPRDDDLLLVAGLWWRPVWRLSARPVW